MMRHCTFFSDHMAQEIHPAAVSYLRNLPGAFGLQRVGGYLGP